MPETLPAALEGATRVFLYAKPAGIDGFVTAARSAGVRHVVLLSSGAIVQPGADGNPIAREHRLVESALEESGLSWTFIRPGMFATNTRWWWTRAIRGGQAVRLPYPEAMTAPLSERDVAALAVTALTERGHAQQAYTVYGPQALTLREQVGHIGAAVGRRIPIEVVTPEQARADLGRAMPAMGWRPSCARGRRAPSPCPRPPSSSASSPDDPPRPSPNGRESKPPTSADHP